MTRALLTSLVCGIVIFLIPNFEQVMEITPLLFGLSVSVVNYKKLKINPIAGIVFFVVLSYLIYYLSIYIFVLSIKMTSELTEVYTLIEDRFQIPINKLTTELPLLIIGILSAISLYLLFSLFLKEQKKILGAILILITSTFIPITIWLTSDDKYEVLVVYHISWLIFISLGFGFAINQLEIKNRLYKITSRN
jgi:hypothetical protein